MTNLRPLEEDEDLSFQTEAWKVYWERLALLTMNRAQAKTASQGTRNDSTRDLKEKHT